MAGTMRRGRTEFPLRAPPRKRVTRLSRAERERQIIQAAIRFFAEVGFAGRTRELAERAGITQPLLYRYFATKRALIDRVFEEVFLKRMDPHWGQLIANRSRPLEERLVEFYAVYSRATYTYELIRIYMFSALMGNNFNRRYIGIVEDTILKPICNEIRHYCGLPGADVIPISELGARASLGDARRPLLLCRPQIHLPQPRRRRFPCCRQACGRRHAQGSEGDQHALSRSAGAGGRRGREQS